MFPGGDTQRVLQQLSADDPVSPRRIRNTIPADLETIVLKAVNKNRDDRYQSAAEFAADLDCFLHDRPISATRPGWLQHAVRCTRRHRGAVAAATVLLVLASLGSLVSNIAISKQRNRAEAALAAALRSGELAQAEATKASAINQFLQQILESGNPDKLKGTEYTVRQLLDDISDGLLDSLDDQPEVAASLRSTIGNAYRRLGAPQKAADLLAGALMLTKARVGDDAVETAKCLEDLAWNEAARGQYETAIPYAQQALAIYEHQQVPIETKLHTRWCLQHCLLYGQRQDESKRVAEVTIAACASIATPPPVLASVLHNLAQAYAMQRQYVEAEKYARRAVELHRQVNGCEHVETGWGLDALGRALMGQGRSAEAATVFQEALAIFYRHYPPSHKSVKYTHELLVSIYRQQGDATAAQQLDEQRYVQLLQSYVQAAPNQDNLLQLMTSRGNINAAAEITMDIDHTLADARACWDAADLLAKYVQIQRAAPDSAATLARIDRAQRAEESLVVRTLELCPADAGQQNDLAWWVITRPNCSRDHAAAAVALVEKALTTNSTS
ncbi:MAG: tetratricopeptide repeat protein, partial [Planctomycetales bacterium]|nr:tetratricopeptide repeat protein [Planctomycetales bacterium]